METLEFKKEEFLKFEQRFHEPFFGYISPEGDIIYFNTNVGENSHTAWHNTVASTFNRFVSYAIQGTQVTDLNSLDAVAICPEIITYNTYPGISEIVKRGYGDPYDLELTAMKEFLSSLNQRIKDMKETFKFYRSSGEKIEAWSKFRYNLLLFFKDAYRRKRFFDAIQKKITVTNPLTVKEKLGEQTTSFAEVEKLYSIQLRRELLTYFKDICIQCLGYDSIERFKPNGELPEIGPNYSEADFMKSPRIITSSCPNIYERYYNYLLMNWTVHRLPRKYYNKKTGIFEPSPISEYYQSDKEERLSAEIASIKKLVPLSERPKYFRQ